jgi:hypothetical protein
MDENNSKRKSFFQALVKYFGFVMVFVYFFIGLLLLFMADTIAIFRDKILFQKALGAIILVYALFRAFRVYKYIKNPGNENN